MAELFRLVKYDTVIYPDKWYLIGIQAYPEETISRPLSWWGHESFTPFTLITQLRLDPGTEKVAVLSIDTYIHNMCRYGRILHLVHPLIYIYISYISGWWFQTWLDYFPFHIWDVILPIDFHIFQDGSCTTNQIYIYQLSISPRLLWGKQLKNHDAQDPRIIFLDSYPDTPGLNVSAAEIPWMELSLFNGSGAMRLAFFCWLLGRLTSGIMVYIYMITHIINWFILRVYMVYDVYDIFMYSYLCGLRNWFIVFGGQGKDGEGAHCERPIFGT